MGEALLKALHARWIPSPEVPVLRPARGVIDLVLHEPAARVVVASELQSGLRRLEEQLRWHREKELSLPSWDRWRWISPAGEPVSSRLLIVRSTFDTRRLARELETTLHAAYPARAADVVAALTSAAAPWPGPGMAWMRVEGERAELLGGPARGVSLGR